MFKTIFNMLAGAIIVASISEALAVVRQPPTPGDGPGLPDGKWLDGLAGGSNYRFRPNIVAAGSNQATATLLPSNRALLEIDSGTGGYALPPCYSGVAFSVYNNSGATLTAYPNVNNNPITAAQDTINGSSSLGSLSNHTLTIFSCANTGNWGSK
jgi:hypothetical protein